VKLKMALYPSSNDSAVASAASTAAEKPSRSKNATARGIWFMLAPLEIRATTVSPLHDSCDCQRNGVKEVRNNLLTERY
jgi:hypothetical protein